MSLSNEELKLIFNEVLDERNRIDAEQHKLHHQYIERKMERDAEIKKVCQTATTAFIQWSVVGLSAAVLYFLKTGHWPTPN